MKKISYLTMGVPYRVKLDTKGSEEDPEGLKANQIVQTSTASCLNSAGTEGSVTEKKVKVTDEPANDITKQKMNTDRKKPVPCRRLYKRKSVDIPLRSYGCEDSSGFDSILCPQKKLRTNGDSQGRKKPALQSSSVSDADRKILRGRRTLKRSQSEGDIDLKKNSGSQGRKRTRLDDIPESPAWKTETSFDKKFDSFIQSDISASNQSLRENSCLSFTYEPVWNHNFNQKIPITSTPKPKADIKKQQGTNDDEYIVPSPLSGPDDCFTLCSSVLQHCNISEPLSPVKALEHPKITCGDRENMLGISSTITDSALTLSMNGEEQFAHEKDHDYSLLQGDLSFSSPCYQQIKSSPKRSSAVLTSAGTTTQLPSSHCHPGYTYLWQCGSETFPYTSQAFIPPCGMPGCYQGARLCNASDSGILNTSYDPLWGYQQRPNISGVPFLTNNCHDRSMISNWGPHCITDLYDPSSNLHFLNENTFLNSAGYRSHFPHLNSCEISRLGAPSRDSRILKNNDSGYGCNKSLCTKMSDGMLKSNVGTKFTKTATKTKPTDTLSFTTSTRKCYSDAQKDYNSTHACPSLAEFLILPDQISHETEGKAKAPARLKIFNSQSDDSHTCLKTQMTPDVNVTEKQESEDGEIRQSKTTLGGLDQFSESCERNTMICQRNVQGEIAPFSETKHGKDSSLLCHKNKSRTTDEAFQTSSQSINNVTHKLSNDRISNGSQQVAFDILKGIPTTETTSLSVSVVPDVGSDRLQDEKENAKPGYGKRPVTACQGEEVVYSGGASKGLDLKHDTPLLSVKPVMLCTVQKESGNKLDGSASGSQEEGSIITGHPAFGVYLETNKTHYGNNSQTTSVVRDGLLKLHANDYDNPGKNTTPVVILDKISNSGLNDTPTKANPLPLASLENRQQKKSEKISKVDHEFSSEKINDPCFFLKGKISFGFKRSSVGKLPVIKEQLASDDIGQGDRCQDSEILKPCTATKSKVTKKPNRDTSGRVRRRKKHKMQSKCYIIGKGNCARLTAVKGMVRDEMSAVLNAKGKDMCNLKHAVIKDHSVQTSPNSKGPNHTCESILSSNLIKKQNLFKGQGRQCGDSISVQNTAPQQLSTPKKILKQKIKRCHRKTGDINDSISTLKRKQMCLPQQELGASETELNTSPPQNCGQSTQQCTGDAQSGEDRNPKGSSPVDSAFVRTALDYSKNEKSELSGENSHHTAHSDAPDILCTNLIPGRTSSTQLCPGSPSRVRPVLSSGDGQHILPYPEWPVCPLTVGDSHVYKPVSSISLPDHLGLETDIEHGLNQHSTPTSVFSPASNTYYDILQDFEGCPADSPCCGVRKEFQQLSLEDQPCDKDIDLKRPKNGFMRFSLKYRSSVSQEFPHLQNRKISRILGTRWKSLDTDERQIFEDEFKLEMKERKQQHPDWSYAAPKWKEDSNKTMVSRLRPRNRRQRKHLDILKRPYHRRMTWVPCSRCQKWRKMPCTVAKTLGPNWVCELNEPPYNSCMMPQEQ